MNTGRLVIIVKLKGKVLEHVLIVFIQHDNYI